MLEIIFISEGKQIPRFPVAKKINPYIEKTQRCVLYIVREVIIPKCKYVTFTEYYENQKQVEQDNSQNLVVHEQLSMEEYMGGKSGLKIETSITITSWAIMKIHSYFKRVDFQIYSNQKNNNQNMKDIKCLSLLKKKLLINLSPNQGSVSLPLSSRHNISPIVRV